MLNDFVKMKDQQDEDHAWMQGMVLVVGLAQIRVWRVANTSSTSSTSPLPTLTNEWLAS